MKIYLAADHAGYKLKETTKSFLKDQGYSVEDEGAFELDESDDYPDYIRLAALRVAGDPGSFGIIFGMSGQGEAIMANRFKGVRAAVYYGGNDEIVRLSRMHNNSNILSLGAKFLDEEIAKGVVKLWLSTPFSEDERHRRRNEKIDSNERPENNF